MIFLLVVVEGGGDLNDALEKGFVGLRGGEPDDLPGFVGVPELTGVELAKAAGEGGAMFAWSHGGQETEKAGRQECLRHLVPEQPTKHWGGRID